MTTRWKAISPSQFPWEQDALDCIQRAMPNREPFRAYSNFEFIADDGSINEVDVLIVSRYSIFLVEIKSRPGEVGGDAYTWVWRDGSREYFDDNPLLLTNRKAKKLDSLLGTEPIATGDLILPEVLHGFVSNRDFNQAKKLLTSLVIVDLAGQDQTSIGGSPPRSVAPSRYRRGP